MCGIAGFNWGDKNLINKMCSLISHRGPDQSGSFSNRSVSLGHQRLAIIDLGERSKQPMSDSENSVFIVFNGEIYNYLELRDELKKKYHFKTESDTEVILNAYKEFGEDCVRYFNGAFAFCIYDVKKDILFLARDRLGKKPLFFF